LILVVKKARTSLRGVEKNGPDPGWLGGANFDHQNATPPTPRVAYL